MLSRSDFKFDPATINVPVGGSVVWTNNDDQQHTATSAGNFDAGGYNPQLGDRRVQGNRDLHIHLFFPSFMMGTVVVS